MLPALFRFRLKCRESSRPLHSAIGPGAKARAIVTLNAALQRRSSTGVLAAVALLQVKDKGKVQGSGQECPLHTRKSRFLHCASPSFGRRSFGRNDRML